MVQSQRADVLSTRLDEGQALNHYAPSRWIAAEEADKHSIIMSGVLLTLPLSASR